MTGSDLKSRLSVLGWSQATFARKIGKSQNTISRWISGEIPQIPEWVDAYLNQAEYIKQGQVFIQK